jgi:hypothetical protein
MEAMDLTSNLDPKIGLVVAAVAAIILGVNKIPMSKTRTLGQVWWWRRILPVVPIALGIGLAFIPGVIEGTAGSRLLLGIIAGVAAAHARKVLNRTVAGKE